jgi:hypothetical protein
MLTPRRRRDTALQVATCILLILQVVVTAFPDVCRNYGLNQIIERLKKD